MNHNFISKTQDDETDRLFRNLFIAVLSIALIYVPVFFILEAKLSAFFLMIGLSVFTPLIVYLNSRKKESASRLAFIASCNYYIYSTSIGCGHLTNNEYYCLPAMMLGLLLFNTRRLSHIIFSITLPVFTWFMIKWGGTPQLNTNWMITDNFPNILLQNINFIGASVIMTIILVVFIVESNKTHEKTVNNIKENLNKKIESETKLKLVFDTLPEGVLILDSAGKIIQYNRAALNLLNLDEKLIENGSAIKPFWNAIRKDGNMLLDHEQPVELALTTGSVIKGSVLGLKTEKNSILWMLVNVTPFSSNKKMNADDDGKRVLITLTDITDRINQEEEKNFILEKLQIGLWKYNPFTHSLDWDNSMYQLFDTREHKLVEAYKAKMVEEMNRAPDVAKDFDTTFDIQTKTSEKRVIAERARVIRNEKGVATMIYGINYDVSKEKKLEEELSAERAKALHTAKLASLGELSAGIAHEINNPLAIIVGNIPLLEKFKDAPEKYNSKIESITRSASRITKIVNGLRKFSRTTDNMIYQPCLVADIVLECITLTESKAKSFSINIQADVASQSKILCDEVEIEQVLINLINNAIEAIKFLPEKWINISVADTGSEVMIKVRDSGTGIPGDIADKIFNPFFTTKAVGEGTGLGLSISKGIIDQHKGTIVLNKDEKNTCFELRFGKYDEKPSTTQDILPG